MNRLPYKNALARLCHQTGQPDWLVAGIFNRVKNGWNFKQIRHELDGSVGEYSVSGARTVFDAVHDYLKRVSDEQIKKS